MKKYAIIGEHLGHSISPQIHNSAFRMHQISAVYEKIEISLSSFESTIRHLKKENLYSGFNVTIPYKTKILPFLDSRDRTVQGTGAVNTIRINDGKWEGFNTDVSGFLLPLISLENQIRSCLVLGGGGAARAVIFALLKSPERRKITICIRVRHKGEQILTDFDSEKGIHEIGIENYGEAAKIYPHYDLIVNTTPIGMHPQTEQSPMQFDTPLQKPLIAYDLIYNPVETLFLRKAKNSGTSVTLISGLNMLAGQAVESFKIWTGFDMPLDKTRQLALEALQV